MNPEQIILSCILLGFVTILLLDIINTNIALYLTTILIMVIIPLVSTTVTINSLLVNSVNPILILLSILGILAKLSTNSRIIQQFRTMLSNQTNPWKVLAIVIVISTSSSSFLNNALIVSLTIPILQEVSRLKKWNPSTFLMALSFSSMLGGTITIIGSSTNLIAQSLLEPNLQLGMFSLTGVSLCCAVVGNMYLWVATKLYLDNKNNTGCRRQSRPGVNINIQLCEIPELSHLNGKIISQTDILEIDGYQLCGIQRGNNFFGLPPRNSHVLCVNDILIYLGTGLLSEDWSPTNTEAGIVLVNNDNMSSLVTPNIASGTIPNFFSEIVGKKYGEIQLKQQFGLVLLAINRSDQILRQRLGRVTVQKSDTLIVYGNYPESAMISALSKICQRVRMICTKLSKDNIRQLSTTYELLVWLSFIVIISVGTTKFTNINIVALMIGLVLYISQLLTDEMLRDTLYQQRSLLVGTIASLIISQAIHQTELSSYLAQPFHYLPNINIVKGWDMWYCLLAVHFLTSILSLVLSNVAVVAILIPIVRDLYLTNQASLYLISTAVIHGASSCFASPTGYHTNLMVGPVGGYLCRDFLIVGLPLHIITSLTFATATYLIHT